MSLGYPFYEELVRRRHPAAWWWLVGDRLYYLGLLPAMLAVPAAVVAVVAGLLGLGWAYLVGAAVTVPVGLVVWFVGSSLKGYAYDLAKQDDITPR